MLSIIILIESIKGKIWIGMGWQGQFLLSPAEFLHVEDCRQKLEVKNKSKKTNSLYLANAFIFL
jgi:hypothetical protein